MEDEVPTFEILASDLERAQSEATETLPRDLRIPVSAAILRQAESDGRLTVGTAERVTAEALAALGVDVAPGGPLRRIAGAVLVEMVERGQLHRLRHGGYEAVEWYDIAEHPGYQVSGRPRRVRNKRTGRVLRTREDSRGRELVDLGGKTHDVGRLTRLV